MAGPIPPDEGEEILPMQRGVRDWVLRSSRQGEQGFRRVSPPVLLSLLTRAEWTHTLRRNHSGGPAHEGTALGRSAGGRPGWAACSKAWARLISVGSLQAGPMKDRPTGSPAT